MIGLKYSLVIEATEDPSFFCFYSPDLPGFSGVGHSIEDCVYKGRWGMEEHTGLMAASGMTAPKPRRRPRIVIQDAATLKRAG
jgi:predicted RNase H-like HicB family nuclease